jgi:hypothetical protein
VHGNRTRNKGTETFSQIGSLARTPSIPLLICAPIVPLPYQRVPEVRTPLGHNGGTPSPPWKVSCSIGVRILHTDTKRA